MLSLLLAAALAAPPDDDAALQKRVDRILAKTPLVDGHNDVLWEARAQVAYDFSKLDVGTGGTPTHTDLPRMRAGDPGGSQPGQLGCGQLPRSIGH